MKEKIVLHEGDYVVALVNKDTMAIEGFVKSITFKMTKEGNSSLRITPNFEEAVVFLHCVSPEMILNLFWAHHAYFKKDHDFVILTRNQVKNLLNKENKNG